jgi:hypothetical protein
MQSVCGLLRHRSSRAFLSAGCMTAQRRQPSVAASPAPHTVKSSSCRFQPLIVPPLRRPGPLALAAVGLVISPRLAPSMSVMNRSPVPVSTSIRLPRSSPISYSARGNSVCVVPVKSTGPPSVWNRKVSTPDGVRLRLKFLKAVKYAGSGMVIVEFLAGSSSADQASLFCGACSGAWAGAGRSATHREPVHAVAMAHP